MSEPEWKEHDGSAVCPVPAHYRVQILLKVGGIIEARADKLTWNGNIIGYRVIEPATAFEQEQSMSKDEVPEGEIDAMVNRFLMWKLPADFAPDGGISFEPIMGGIGRTIKREPVGTNLLTATQAKAMIRHILGVPEPAPVDPLRGAVNDALADLEEQYGRKWGAHDLAQALRARGVTAAPAAGGA